MCVTYLLIINLIIIVSSSPINSVNESRQDAQKILLSALGEFYDKYIDSVNFEKTEKTASNYSKHFDETENLDEEKMMGDFPASDTILNTDSENLKNLVASLNKNHSNFTNPTVNSVNFRTNFTAERENAMESAIIESVKKQWLMFIQKSILEKTGRSNNMTSVPTSITEPVVRILNQTGSITTELKNSESESESDEFVNKKIRSYYPSCDIPRNTDEEIWKETNIMNLFFNVDYNSGVSTGANVEQQGQEETVNIAYATLRLYRLPQDGNSTFGENYLKNNNHNLSDEDKKLRVSVYWYSRSLKKHKAVKRRLADSRMIPLYPPTSLNTTSTPTRHYVEFNVRPAAKSWTRGRNLGIGVVVEDMDGNHLNPAAIFKTPHCDTVGNVSTPIPIPTAFLDAHRNAISLTGQNGTKIISSVYDILLPNLDICTIELTHNFSTQNNSRHDASKIVCKILTPTTDEVKYTSDSETVEIARHRHHHSVLANVDKFVSKRLVVKNAQIHDLNSQVKLQNISDVNR